MTTKKFKYLPKSKKAYILALALTQTLAVASCNTDSEIYSKEFPKIEQDHSLEHFYADTLAFLPPNFDYQELKIVTRNPACNLQAENDYFFISTKQYIECDIDKAIYKKYPRLTNQNDYVVDYELAKEDFYMIPCGVHLDKSINKLPDDDITFRYGIFELADILSSDLIKDSYSLKDLAQIELQINKSDYQLETLDATKTYLFSSLILLEDESAPNQKLYLVNPEEFILTAEPLTTYEDYQTGYQCYRCLTLDKIIYEKINLNTKTQEITYNRSNTLDDETSLYITNIGAYLPDYLIKNECDLTNLKQIENYFNENKEELFAPSPNRTK